MSSNKQQPILDIVAGTSLIMVGVVGVLGRLGVLDLAQVPQWAVISHLWPWLLILAGLLTWLSDLEQVERTKQSYQEREMPYGK
ncbi:MAG TPA: hypothetical protein VKW78_03595 [Terriglobales bacterium]|nr:hypothetical protein [Terriglobales bacterium]